MVPRVEVVGDPQRFEASLLGQLSLPNQVSGGMLFGGEHVAESSHAAALPAATGSKRYAARWRRRWPGQNGAVSVRAIRQIGDPVLRTPSDPVRDFDDRLRALVAALEESVDAPGHAGLAAPQIGVGLRVFSYNIDGKIGHLVNPRLVERSAETETQDEGCLSIPGVWFPTVRSTYAVAEGLDQHGQPLTLSGHGLMARCLQHEIDHLDGRLYLDRLTGDTKRAAYRALA